MFRITKAMHPSTRNMCPIKSQDNDAWYIKGSSDYISILKFRTSDKRSTEESPLLCGLTATLKSHNAAVLTSVQSEVNDLIGQDGDSQTC